MPIKELHILSDFVARSRVNQVCTEIGLDSLDHCLDKKHFCQYPDSVEYQFNSRGYRDAEWPSDLANSIWCVGDSATVGLGTPYEHIWPQVLQRKLNRRTINLSIVGVSNNWIARRAAIILKRIQPKDMIILWSYVERREIDNTPELQKAWQMFYSDVKDPSWPTIERAEHFIQLSYAIRQELALQHLVGNTLFIHDDLESVYISSDDESRRMQISDIDDISDEENFKNCLQTLTDANISGTRIVHAFIPKFAVKKEQVRYLTILKGHKVIPPFLNLDWARDYHHFDRKTSNWLVEQIIQLYGKD